MTVIVSAFECQQTPFMYVGAPFGQTVGRCVLKTINN